MSQNQSLKLVGPRPGELFADQAANALWAAVLTLDVALQHELLARLREKLAVPVLEGGTHEGRIAGLTDDDPLVAAAYVFAGETFLGVPWELFDDAAEQASLE